MTPDSEMSRIARLEQRTEDIAQTMVAFAPTVTVTATLGVQIGHIEEDIKNVRLEIRELRDALDTRDAQITKERKDTRVALWSLVGVLGAAMISAGAAILIALLNHA